jgi:glycosyltransferase involved in cell wall biosynthesis
MALLERPARLLVAGDGPLRHQMETRALSLGVSERVEFLGLLSDVQISTLFARAAVIAVPSEWPEPFGMVGAEALAHNRPVVGTAVGGSAEWLHDGVTGLVIPPRNALALAGAISRLQADVNLSARLGANGRQLVMERLTVEDHATSLLRVFKGAVGRRRKPVGPR